MRIDLAEKCGKFLAWFAAIGIVVAFFIGMMVQSLSPNLPPEVAAARYSVFVDRMAKEELRGEQLRQTMNAWQMFYHGELLHIDMVSLFFVVMCHLVGVYAVFLLGWMFWRWAKILVRVGLHRAGIKHINDTSPIGKGPSGV